MLENFEKIVLEKLRSIKNQLPISVSDLATMLGYEEKIVQKACNMLYADGYISGMTADDVDNAPKGFILYIHEVY